MIVDENGMCTLSEEDCSYHSHTAKRTNADKIRSMSDEELAELWWERVDCGECPVHRDCRMTGQDCKKLALDYLRKVEE
jgi:hypothetical protein